LIFYKYCLTLAIKIFFMKAFVAISVLDSNQDLGEAINRLLKSSVLKDIFIIDVTINGIDKELMRFIKSYNRFGVYYLRVKNAKINHRRNERANMAIAESLLKFNSIKSDKYSTYSHIHQGMLFQTGEFQMFSSNAMLYHCISPVIESYNGIEVLRGMFDRYGFEVVDLKEGTIHFITGQLEDSFALNPKCFCLSRAYANKLKDFYYSNEDPVRFINTIAFNSTASIPKVDTNLFIHEHIY